VLKNESESMNKFGKIDNSEGLLKIYTNESEIAKKLREKLKKMAENRGIPVTDKQETIKNERNRR